MELKLVRYSNKKDSTGGLIFVDGAFHCFTCEDERREKKLAGETRIPEGRYQILLRNTGGMTKRYAKRFPRLHRGMLHLQDVPGFSWIYIHVGNTEANTEGCPLVGYGARVVAGEMQVTNSVDAYLGLYQQVVAAMDKGEEINITIKEI